MLKFQYELGFTPKQDISTYTPKLQAAHQSLLAATCPGNDFLGWITWPDTDNAELAKLLAGIKHQAQKIRDQAAVLVVIGTGGSYLGSLAGLEFLRGNYYNDLQPECQIYFAGHDLSIDNLLDIKKIIGDRDFYLNVISKSGTTLEPALTFDFLWELAREKYGDQADEHICATTDAAHGTLHDLAAAHHWSSFPVPDDIGGRYSGMTAVGLLPLAVAGIDIEKIIAGTATARKTLTTDLSIKNPAWQYAAVRQELLAAGKTVEFFTTYEPRFASLGLWWQQLFGESEGKTGRVILPAYLQYTRDLHSMGQFLQQGSRNLTETVFHTATPARDLVIAPAGQHSASDDATGQKWSRLQQIAIDATRKAHLQGGVPQLQITIDTVNEEALGYTWYFFEFACALSALLLEVNPFDQPGVQDYKAEMMAQLAAAKM